MRLLDKIALHRFLSLITNFIIALAKILKTNTEKDPATPIVKPSRPILDKIRKILRK